MNVEKMTQEPIKNPNLLVKCTEMGNVLEIQYMSHRNNKQSIMMLPGGEQYVVCSTGDVLSVEHHETRADQKKNLYRTFANARALINTNVTNVINVRWITLTYRENMKDTKRLYEDFKKFNQRFQYYCKTKGYGNPEYIVMMEPQGRGAWHAHLLYIWEHKAPYIPNSELSEIWGHGFVKIKKLDNVDNVGAYLTAYLGDMEINESIQGGTFKGGKVKEAEVMDDDGKAVKKCFVKGARLCLYPANFNMIRYSRGIKKPDISMITQEEAEKKVSHARKTFSSNFKLTDDSGNEIIISKDYYNKARGN